MEENREENQKQENKMDETAQDIQQAGQETDSQAQADSSNIEQGEETAEHAAQAADGKEDDADAPQEADETQAEDAEGQPEETAGAEPGTAKKGFFKKGRKKDKKDEKIEELTDQVKRQMAEFDNFRKRTEKEKTQMYEIGAKSIIEKVLPVVDNFERGLAAVPEEDREDAFVDGMNKVYKQMMTMLEEAGVVPIEAVGKEFDPNLHNAVMQTESEEYESGIVAQELQKGYMYRDSVVRHSMVAVVN